MANGYNIEQCSYRGLWTICYTWEGLIEDVNISVIINDEGLSSDNIAIYSSGRIFVDHV